MPYHPETNGQCVRFNQMLINMIRTLESNDKQHWKDYLPTLVHAYNCTKNNAVDFSPYYLMYGHKPRLPIDNKFSLLSSQTGEHSHNKFVAKLSTQLWQCYELTDRHQCKESTCHKQQYDWKMRASRLTPRDLWLIWQKAFTGKHKVGDCWEITKYVVVERQCNLPVYMIKAWKGDGWTWIVHRNLLMHIAPPYCEEGMKSESEDSDYDTPPGYVGLSEPNLRTTGPVIWVKLGLASWLKIYRRHGLSSPIHPVEVKEQLKVVGKLLMALVMKVNTGLALLNFDLGFIWRIHIYENKSIFFRSKQSKEKSSTGRDGNPHLLQSRQVP